MKFPRINIIFAADGIALSGLLPTKTQAFFRLLERYIHIQLPLFAHSQERIIYKQFPLILNLFSHPYDISYFFSTERETHIKKRFEFSFVISRFQSQPFFISSKNHPNRPIARPSSSLRRDPRW